MSIIACDIFLASKPRTALIKILINIKNKVENKMYKGFILFKIICANEFHVQDVQNVVYIYPSINYMCPKTTEK